MTWVDVLVLICPPPLLHIQITHVCLHHLAALCPDPAHKAINVHFPLCMHHVQHGINDDEGTCTSYTRTVAREQEYYWDGWDALGEHKRRGQHTLELLLQALDSNSVWSRAGTLMEPTTPLYCELLTSRYQDQGHLEWSEESTYTRQHSN